MKSTAFGKLIGSAASNSFGATLSTFNALSAIGEVREFLHQRRTLSGMFAEEPDVDTREWLRFYDSPKLFEREFLRPFCPENLEKLTSVLDALRNPIGSDRWSIGVANGLIKDCLSDVHAAPYSELANILLDDSLPDTESEEEIDETDCTAFCFYMWVYLPCWFVYGITPTKLLRQVSGKDRAAETAAERLVRLDHRVTVHVKIQRWIKAEPKIASFRREKLQKWKKRSPFDKEKSNSQALRMVAGYVSRTSELLNERLESSDICDAIQSLGDKIPADLQEYLANKTTDDWSREIRRYRDHLVDMPNPDKSIFERVRADMRNAR